MIHGSRRSRILSGISANLFAQIANVGIQLAGVPLLLHYWGVGYYGEWLLLFSIPSYLGLSDLGMGTVATTEVSMAVARQDYEHAQRVFRGAFFSIASFGLLVCTVFYIALWICPLHQWLHLEQINPRELNLALSFLVIYVLMAIFLSLPLGMYRSAGYYGRGQIISTLFRIAEFLSLLVVVIGGGGVVLAAAAFMVVRLCYVTFIWFDIRQKATWLRLKKFSWEWPTVRPLLLPSFSMMTVYLGQTLVTQGIVTIIGITLGSVQVVLFSTVRTLCNFARQLVGIINLSIFTEFAITTGNEDLPATRRLHIRSIQANVGLTLLSVIGLKLFGPWVLVFWTKGSIVVEEPFFTLYIAYVLVNSLWIGSWNMLLACNRHQSITRYFLLMSGTVMFAAYFGVSAFKLNIIPIALLLSDAAFSWLVLRKSLDLLQQSPPAFFRQVFAWPIRQRL